MTHRLLSLCFLLLRSWAWHCLLGSAVLCTQNLHNKKLHRWRQLTLRPGMDDGDIGYGVKSDSALLVIFLNEHEGSIKLFFFFFFVFILSVPCLCLHFLSLCQPSVDTACGVRPAAWAPILPRAATAAPGKDSDSWAISPLSCRQGSPLTFI